MTKRPSASTPSSVWKYFDIDENDSSIAKCNSDVCSAKSRLLSRGSTTVGNKGFSTGSLWRHLKAFHPEAYADSTNARDRRTNAKKAKQEETAEKSSIYHLRQPLITEVMEKRQTWSADNPNQKELTFMVGEWLCNSLLPYTTVGDERFVAFCARMNPKFVVPSEKEMRQSVIPDIYVRVRQKVEELLNDSFEYCCVTTDLWNSQSQHSFLSFTVHFIDSDWCRKMAVLQCFPFDESHTATNIADCLRKISVEWNLDEKIHVIVSDNALNMKNAVQILNWHGVGCFCHTLHLVIKHAIFDQSGVKLMMNRATRLVSYFRRSPKAKAILERCQKELQLPTNALILGVATRWSSYYQMLTRLIEQKVSIRRAEDDPELKLTADHLLTPNDWCLIPKVVTLLKPFAEATSDAEKESSCLSDVIPLLKIIKHDLNRTKADGTDTLKTALLAQLERYFGGDDPRENFVNVEKNELHSLSTLLDPRYKDRGFSDRQCGEEAKDLLKQKILTLKGSADDLQLQTASDSDLTIMPPKKDNNSESRWDAIASSDEDEQREEDDGAEQEILSYLADKRIPQDADPLAYWKQKRMQWPTVARLAKRYLSSPIGSVASEREFKTASSIANAERIRLLPENIEKLLFLKYNLRAIGYHTINLPPASKASAELNFDSMANIEDDDI